MARRPTKSQIRAFMALVDKLAPGIRKAFMSAIQDWRAKIDWQALIAALERYDVDGAISALNLSQAALSAFSEAKRGAFIEGGNAAVAEINLPTGSTVAVRFDMSNPAAERWIAENVGNLITQITSEEVSSVRSAILAGYEVGNHPEKIALEISGRVVNGRRVGGLIGLSAPQKEYVLSMRRRLESGDPEELRKVLSGMTRRDKRYDALIQRHIASGKPIPADKIDRMVERYSDRLMALRAETIARTETAMAVAGGRAEEWRQAAAQFGYDPSAVIKTWRHGMGVREPRWWHIAMNGKSVNGLDTPFTMATGALMQYPHDENGGARENANCSCGVEFRINHSIGLE